MPGGLPCTNQSEMLISISVILGSAQIEIAEDILKFRDHEVHDAADNTEGETDDHYRVDQGADDLAPQLGRLLHKLGETLEDRIQDASRLSGGHHVDVQAIEDLRVLCQGFRQCGSTFDIVGRLP